MILTKDQEIAVAEVIDAECKRWFTPTFNNDDHSMAVSLAIYGAVTIRLVKSGMALEDALDYEATEQIRVAMVINGYVLDAPTEPLVA